MPDTVAARRTTGHVAALDGVRGLAILLVLVFHFTVFSHMTADTLGERVYRGIAVTGWSGVDLFFVLSGFLITGILIDAKEGAHFFRNFYARRFLRILPLYYVALAILLWLLPTVLPRLAPASSALDGVWYWTYLSNVRAAAHGWSNTLVDHFWSLAIEEQFYLVWPMVIFFAGRRTVPVICVAILVGAFALRSVLAWRGEEIAAYTFTACRADALAAGGLVACLVRSDVARERIARGARGVLAATAGLVAVLIVARHGLHFGDPIVASVGYSLLACMYAALIAATFAAPEASALKRVFSRRELRLLGRYSYGVYVFHQPVAALMERAGVAVPDLPRVAGSHLLTGVAVVLAGSIVSVGLALLSWHAFEARFLKLKEHFEYSGPRVPAAIASPIPDSDTTSR